MVTAGLEPACERHRRPQRPTAGTAAGSGAGVSVAHLGIGPRTLRCLALGSLRMELPRRQSFVTDTQAVPTAHGLNAAVEESPVVVVGGGPSGLRVAQELARRAIPVIQFNAERWRPYNRLKLTPFLAGEVQIGIVYQPNLFPDGARVTQYTGQTIVAIDRAAKTVENQFGRRWTYSKLVLSLGSHPHIPPIPGRDTPGVYRFRNFDDVELLIARSMRSRRTVVIGGGLLGLEAARSMALRKVNTVVVEHETHLMARQLDRAAGCILAEQIAAMGIEVRTGCSVKMIDGDARVERVILTSSEAIACDSVVICTGIRSNVGLARDAGIAVCYGITVGNTMQTSDPDIYAVGECAEHDGHIYGLVAPGLEQAAVAAAHIAGDAANYRGSLPTTKLKIVGTDVFSMGDVEQLDQRTDVRSLVWQDDPAGVAYRRLVLRRGRVVGAMAVGDWPEVGRIQQAVRDRELVWPWQAWRLRRSGRLHPVSRPKSAAQWPAAATVCNCTGVTRGHLGDAMRLGATSVELLMRETNASTVCGTCRPLLHEILGVAARHEPVFGARTIAVASAAALLAVAAAILLPAWPYSPSLEQGIGIDELWIDGTWKQVTGFTLIGLSLLIAFLSVRKRIGMKWLGDYKAWRIIHVTIGVAALAVLFLHTGFNLGHNLNRWLMLTFLAVVAIGGFTGIVTAAEHALLANDRASPRAAFVWAHILVFWPLPMLLLLHVVTVYAY
jgi:NADPH-dependent 2,4-dienoyl-CoA reductase/sulfur reductase-like enzyme/bacterioferritin-associated ferredoxin